MKVKVVIQQQDLEKSNLLERLLSFSKEIIRQGDRVIISPSWDLNSLMQLLSEEHISYGIENFHLLRRLS